MLKHILLFLAPRPLPLVIILRLRIKARTGLADVRQVTVTKDVRLRVAFAQVFQQPLQGYLLPRCARVVIFPLRRQTTLVADADAALVITPGVGTDQLFVARLVRRTVLGDVIVVAREPEARIVACDEVLDGEPTVTARGAAVNDNQINLSHSLTSCFLPLASCL